MKPSYVLFLTSHLLLHGFALAAPVFRSEQGAGHLEPLPTGIAEALNSTTILHAKDKTTATAVSQDVNVSSATPAGETPRGLKSTLRDRRGGGGSSGGAGGGASDGGASGGGGSSGGGSSGGGGFGGGGFGGGSSGGGRGHWGSQQRREMRPRQSCPSSLYPGSTQLADPGLAGARSQGPLATLPRLRRRRVWLSMPRWRPLYSASAASSRRFYRHCGDSLEECIVQEGSEMFDGRRNNEKPKTERP